MSRNSKSSRQALSIAHVVTPFPRGLSLNVLYDGKYFMSEKQEEQKLRQTKYNPHETENACLSCTIENEIHVRPFFCSNGGGRTMDNASDKKKRFAIVIYHFYHFDKFFMNFKEGQPFIYEQHIHSVLGSARQSKSTGSWKGNLLSESSLGKHWEITILPYNSRKENVDFPQNETLLDPSEMISVEMINFRIV